MNDDLFQKREHKDLELMDSEYRVVFAAWLDAEGELHTQGDLKAALHDLHNVWWGYSDSEKD